MFSFLALSMAAGPVLAEVIGVGEVVMDGTFLVSATTADGYTVTVEQLRNGTTTAPGGVGPSIHLNGPMTLISAMQQVTLILTQQNYSEVKIGSMSTAMRRISSFLRLPVRDRSPISGPCFRMTPLANHSLSKPRNGLTPE